MVMMKLTGKGPNQEYRASLRETKEMIGKMLAS